MRKLPWFLPLILVCVSCSQSDVITIITDGAEAATVAAMITVQTTLPAEAALITSGMKEVDALALAILNDQNSTLTLQQLLDLAFSQNPKLKDLQAIVDFCLPVIMDISVVKNSLNTLVQKLNPKVKQDVIAFFNGIAAGLGQPATQAQLNRFLQSHPNLAKARARVGAGKFDTGDLINQLNANR